MVNKSTYIILDKTSGNTLCSFEDPAKKVDPVMAVFKDNCLIISQNMPGTKRAQYLMRKDVAGLAPYPVFNLDATRLLVKLLYVEGDYVLAIYDTCVQIFNATTGDYL